jgi:hypothetical protein
MSEYNRPSRVFVVNYGFHDYTAATRFGKLIPVTSGNVDHIHTDRLEAQIQSVLSEMDPAHDYVLLSGSPMVNWLSAGYLARTFPTARINYLYWEGLYSDYVERSTEFSRRELPNASEE